MVLVNEPPTPPSKKTASRPSSPPGRPVTPPPTLFDTGKIDPPTPPKSAVDNPLAASLPSPSYQPLHSPGKTPVTHATSLARQQRKLLLQRHPSRPSSSFARPPGGSLIKGVSYRPLLGSTPPLGHPSFTVHALQDQPSGAPAPSATLAPAPASSTELQTNNNKPVPPGPSMTQRLAKAKSLHRPRSAAVLGYAAHHHQQEPEESRVKPRMASTGGAYRDDDATQSPSRRPRSSNAVRSSQSSANIMEGVRTSRTRPGSSSGHPSSASSCGMLVPPTQWSMHRWNCVPTYSSTRGGGFGAAPGVARGVVTAPNNSKGRPNTAPGQRVTTTTSSIAVTIDDNERSVMLDSNLLPLDDREQAALENGAPSSAAATAAGEAGEASSASNEPHSPTDVPRWKADRTRGDARTPSRDFNVRTTGGRAVPMRVLRPSVMQTEQSTVGVSGGGKMLSNVLPPGGSPYMQQQQRPPRLLSASSASAPGLHRFPKRPYITTKREPLERDPLDVAMEGLAAMLPELLAGRVERPETSDLMSRELFEWLEM